MSKMLAPMSLMTPKARIPLSGMQAQVKTITQSLTPSP